MVLFRIVNPVSQARNEKNADRAGKAMDFVIIPIIKSLFDTLRRVNYITLVGKTYRFNEPEMMNLFRWLPDVDRF